MSEDLGLANDPVDPASQNSTEPLACVSCRSRKLKCDRTKPSCGRCVKVSNDCVYPESRRKPTFKRRNVKELEARLAQVEGYLKEVAGNGVNEAEPLVSPETDIENIPDFDFSTTTIPNQTQSMPAGPIQDEVPAMMPDFADSQNGANTFFGGGELMDLGISESLPPFEVMEDLNNIYFASQHYYIPVVHPGRYLKAFYGGPMMKPPMCLQYSIWALASYFNDKYRSYSDVFYQRARHYIDADEMKGSGEHFITLFHAQAYAVLASFEAKMMLFTRAAMTSAKCVRLVQMMGLDKLDGGENSFPPSLAPAASWIELEERRRTFWGAYCIDAHASIAAGWPSLIVCGDVETRLPCSEEAFTSGREEEAAFLDDVFTGASYTGFAGTIVICRMFKKIIHHVHRTKAKDRPDDMMRGRFWSRHRELDNELSSAFMFLPDKFRLPRHYRDPNAVHTNLNLHASVICLHHAAIEKAEKYGHTDAIKQGSIFRMKAAADEIATIIKMTSHQLALFRSPLCALSMYCATTVYILLAKENPEVGLDAIDTANLELIISGMEAIARVHEISRTFLQQACLDVERNGLDSVIRLPNLNKYRDIFGGTASFIPMLARNGNLGNHSDAPPVLPGRLPLGNPIGKMRPSNLRLPKANVSPEEAEQTATCFHILLGAARRNTANNTTTMPAPGETIMDPSPDFFQNHKRKRQCTEEDGSSQGGESIGADLINISFLNTNDGFSRVINGGGQFSFPDSTRNIVLPDRTNSSTAASSPLNRASIFGTDTQSGSSGTSPEQQPPQQKDQSSDESQQSQEFWTEAEEIILSTMTSGGSQRTDPWNLMNVGV